MEIQEIKSKLTLAQILQHYGLKPDKNLRLNCLPLAQGVLPQAAHL